VLCRLTPAIPLYGVHVADSTSHIFCGLAASLVAVQYGKLHIQCKIVMLRAQGEAGFATHCIDLLRGFIEDLCKTTELDNREIITLRINKEKQKHS